MNRALPALLAIGLALPLPAAAQRLSGPPSPGTTGALVTLPAFRDNLNNGNIYRRTLADFGAKCDVHYATSFTVAAGSTALVLTSGNTFPASMIGGTYKAILPGHGTGGAPLITTLTPTDTTHATLGGASVPGTISQYALSMLPLGTGSAYAPGDTVTIAGGTLAATGGTPAIGTVKTTYARAASIAAAGTGGTNGTWTVYGTTGNGQRAVFSLTVAAGAATAVSVIAGGHYTGNPTAPSAEPVATSQSGVTLPTGLTLSLTMGVDAIDVTAPGLYKNGGMPANPVSQASTSGSGTGATFTIEQEFNSGGIVYGTDDHDAIQEALNPSTWPTPPPSGANVIIEVPPKPCGTGSTIIRSASRVSLEGQGTRAPVDTQQPVVVSGPALQWLGSSGGTVLQDAPTGSGASYYNRVLHLTFSCGVPSNVGNKFSVPVAGIGIDSKTNQYAEYGDLSFDGCLSHAIVTGVTATGTVDELAPHIHDIELWQPLYSGDPAIYVSGGASGHDTDYAVIERVYGSFQGAPPIFAETLDNLTVRDVHLFQRGTQNVFGLVFGCQVYGSAEANQANTALGEALATTSVMLGKESCASPPQNVLVRGHDVTNGRPLTTVRPGAGFIDDLDYNGKHNTYLVSTLPTCNAATDTVTALVSDLLSPTYGAAPTGGGTLKGRATCTNGTGWRLQ